MKSLVEDRSAEYRQQDAEWKARIEIYRQMVRAGWKPGTEDFEKEAKRRLIERFPYLEGPPGSKPNQNRNPFEEKEQGYTPVPTRMPTGRHSMMIQDHGYGYM